MLSDAHIALARAIASGQDLTDEQAKEAVSIGWQIGAVTRMNSCTDLSGAISQYVQDIDAACDGLRAEDDWGWDE